MESNRAPLSIGLIVDSGIGSKYLLELAEWGQKQSNLRISHLIIQENKQAQQGKIAKALSSWKRHGMLHLAEQVSFAMLVRLENIILCRMKCHKDHLAQYDLQKIITQSISIEPRVSKSGFVYSFTNEDVDRVKSLNLDLLIRCGSGILRGEILNSAKFGVLSFHHGDNRINRGGPPGYWEVYFRQDTTGFVIQQLTEELDGGKVLIRGQLPTQPFYLLNQALVQKKSNVHLMNLLSGIAETRALPPPKESQPYFNNLFRRPSLANQFAYASRFTAKFTYKVVTRILLRKKYRWGVAFCRGNWKDLVMWRSNVIENPPNHFLADPFVINEGGRDFCFVEDYDYGKKRGCISVYELKERSAERIGEAIVEPFHMSFPYLFRFQGKLYMCPETSENMDIRLYECVNFPLRWKLAKVLMSNVSAVDTMIFQRGGLWWMFTNIDPANTDDHCSELFIFYSSDPLGDEWMPHRKNPVMVDSSKARNGGLVFHEGRLYRVAQKQGFDRYGKGFSINRISVLNKEAYIEKELCSVEPNFFPDLKGTHHLHSDSSVLAFDYMRLTTVSD